MSEMSPGTASGGHVSSLPDEGPRSRSWTSAPSPGVDSDASDEGEASETGRFLGLCRTIVRVNSDDRPGDTGRRVGREAILDAAADLFAGVDLPTAIGGIVGVRAVAAAAGISPATVNHHFRAGDGPRNERLAAAAMDHALLRASTSGARLIAEASLTTIDALRQGDPEALARLATIAADDVLWFSPDVGTTDTDREARMVATFLGAAAAPQSPQATRSLSVHYDDITKLYCELYQALLDATGRRLIAGLDLEAFSNVFTALADGFILRRRFQPDQAPAALFGDVVVRLFEALTSPAGSSEDSNPADNLLPLPPGSGLDVHKRAAIVRAAIEVYRRDGWDGVTVSAVEAESDVSRRTIIANLGDRNGLAAAIWSQFLPGLKSGLAADAELPVHRRITRHLQRVVELTRAHHHLTGALVTGMLTHSIEHGPPSGTDPADPRLLVPLPMLLAPVLLEDAEALRPGLADGEAEATRSSILLTITSLNLALSQPAASASEVTATVSNTVIAGMLRRRPTHW